ncbi:hypothetical protein [Pseudomonas turukhanskensis]|uniref:Uncharacterized protein n=1 Tax=Pseudomonas turukhanskensis TaxID=1806536 RepID=A0A9W6K3N1_9PSED|nr:hypothetical protein [Pseudomonas turukhanskensis]GLK88267.1 hypothetical protein GCM10017655_13290 [Pseudomonas turukhanskensis]
MGDAYGQGPDFLFQGEAMMSDNNPPHCQLVLSQFPLLRLFGHNLLVFVDATGTVIAELDGLATSKTGSIKPVGYLPSDRLKVYQFSASYLYRHQQPRVVLYKGSRLEVQQRWAAALRGKDAINALGLAYPLFGLGRNSNSVTSTLIACMGLYELAIPNGKPAPWEGHLLLPRGTIAAIRKEMVTGANTGIHLDVH